VELDTALQMCPTRAEQGGRIISLDLLVTLFLIEPRVLLTSLAARAHCWLMVSLLSTRTSKSLCKTAFQSVGSQYVLVLGFIIL